MRRGADENYSYDNAPTGSFTCARSTRFAVRARREQHRRVDPGKEDERRRPEERRHQDDLGIGDSQDCEAEDPLRPREK